MLISKQNLKALSLFELLILITLISISLSPTLYIVRQLQPSKKETNFDILAALISHHVIETIIAQLQVSSNNLSTISVDEEKFTNSKYFENIQNILLYLENNQENIRYIYNFLNQLKLKIEKYFIDNNFFKIVVTIKYTDTEGSKKFSIDRVIKVDRYE